LFPPLAACLLNMPETLSILFIALILAATFKLFFDDWKDLKTNFKEFLWWFGFGFILNLPSETEYHGFRFLFWFGIASFAGLLFYHNLIKYF
jgi:hypothetical protein